MSSTAACGNKVRSLIRNKSNRNDVVYASLQPCRLKENQAVLDAKISKVSTGSTFGDHLRGLRAILDCLQAKLTYSDGSTRILSYLEYDEAFNLYVAYNTVKDSAIVTEDERTRFRELLLHPEFGLCVYLVKVGGNHWIVLRPDDLDLEDFFLHLSKMEPSNSDRFDLNKENLQKLYRAIDTEWDRKIFRVILGSTRTRSEFDDLGLIVI